MAIYFDNGVWRVQTNGRNSYNGKTLAEAVRGGQANHLADMCWRPDQYRAIADEIQLQQGPETFIDWCPICSHTTHHALDTGCVECKAYKEDE